MKRNLTALAAASTALLLASATYGLCAVAGTSGEIQAANRDFTKLSTQGMVAIHDVGQARLDIFDGNTAAARQNIDAADRALAKAKNDNTAFMEAESDLKAPASINQSKADTVAKQWLPINSAMALDEDYNASPKKKAGVAKANEQIRKGDNNGAMDTLKLTGVGVSFTEELAPLNATITGVQTAKADIDAGLFYEANQDLKKVEDGVRFDTSTVMGVPGKTASTVHS